MKSVGVVVAYFPGDAFLDRIRELLKYVDVVCVVDNTPIFCAAKEASSLERCYLIDNNSNLGVAYAINQGVAYGISINADCVLLFDQDSAPSENIIIGLMEVLKNCRQKGNKIALVGPAFVDENSGIVSKFTTLSRFGVNKHIAVGCKPIDVAYLITSGSCLDLTAWKEIGEMDTDLFIDCVDIEWCLRAKGKGFSILGVPWLHMTHRLGDSTINVLGRKYPLHSSLRHYYFIRNSVSMLMRSYIPMAWKLNILYEVPRHFVLYLFFAPKKMKRLGLMVQAILDGLRGKLGAKKVEIGDN